MDGSSLSPAFVEVIGLAAGTMTTLAFLPQVIKAWRTRKVEDISLVMFLVLVTGVLLWLIYGLFIGDVPLVLANGVTLVLAGAVLVMKLAWDGPFRRKTAASKPEETDY